MMKLGKRSSITDLPFIIGGILSFALVALLVALLLNNFDTQIQGNDQFNANAKAASSKMSSDFPAVVDGMIVFTFFAMVMISLVLAALVPVHPVFLIFYILEYLLLIWLSGGIANAYQEVIENPIFATQANQFVLTTHFFRYFPFFVGVVGAVLAIVVYKTRERFAGQ